MRRVNPEFPVTLNCATTGLPPTLALWYKSNITLSSNPTYQMSQVVKNRMSSDYDNLLSINKEEEAAEGLYECRLRTRVYEPTDNTFIESELGK